MKKLKRILPKRSGRGAGGKVTVRHQGGRNKRFLRRVDFARDKRDIWARVADIEYDPNRNANLALLIYEDGERRYIIAPEGLKIGDKVVAGESSPITPGNALPLAKIPVGSEIHNLEIVPGKGAQLVRGAGVAATVQGKEENYILIKLPSGEIRRFDAHAYATVGKVGRGEYRSIVLGKAGRARNMGIRPTVRGVAQHPNAHPHGGGEGRSGIGLKYPKTVYGKRAVGKTRKRRKYSDHLIVSPRKKGPHVG
ncbi:50S ribosomal protein L2 [Candidatus Woesebacteria bacterium GWB1_43_5]|uniref:50S ribosomal protein L2 n=1 Tax=Candidatus Woesebacteria bacterium GWB1_43_5 TaxID=1802474 RepID=A0A1F7WT92_9BACT|nr:MAG: 50S ribosomal protein L2 [Candidatus Woesebacteria bacterium GWB1_43_5]